MFENSFEMVCNSKILIVDDHRDNLHIMASILRSRGFGAVSTEMDPANAINKYRTVRPDLVIIESNLVAADGMEVLSGIRNIREADYVPVVVVSSDVAPQARLRALRSGATGFLTRPIDGREMVNRIQTLLWMRQCHVRLYRPASALSLSEPHFHPSQTVVVAEHCPVVFS